MKIQKKYTVLVVDDSPLIRLQLVDILEEAGFEVIKQAVNGKEAIKFYKELKPDFVTLDIIMPEKDGIAALKEIKEFDRFAKVIMITAIGKEDTVIKCIKAGAVDFIVKPFNSNNIIEVFEKVKIKYFSDDDVK